MEEPRSINRLVEITRLAGWEQASGSRLDFFFCFRAAKRGADILYARQNAADVAINGRLILSESDGGDGGGGVGSNAGQAADLLQIARKNSPIFFHDQTGGFQQISRPGVIPQSFPGFQNILLAGSSQ